jgi:hypothetical protein
VSQGQTKCKCDNNQTFIIRPAQDWRHVHLVFEETFIKNVANSYSCWWSRKKLVNENMIIPQNS